MRLTTSLLFSLTLCSSTVFSAETESSALSPAALSERIHLLKKDVNLESISGSVENEQQNRDAAIEDTQKTPAGVITHRVIRLEEKLKAIDARINADNDGDGVTIADGDCDDNDPLTYPGAVELNNGVDNNCDGKVDNTNITGS